MGKQRIRELDGLRALAIGLVVVHHTVTKNLEVLLYQLRWEKLGNLLDHLTSSGVQLFYVLSGILLLSPYLKGERPFSPERYFWRRAERLGPSYAASWLFVGAMAAALSAWPSWFSLERVAPFAWEAWLAQVFIFDPYQVYYNPVMWSLEVELSFYPTLPLWLWLYRRTRPGKLGHLLAFGLATAVSLGLQQVARFHFEPFPLNIISTFGLYLPCFLLGVALAGQPFTAREGAGLALLGGAYVGASLVWAPANVAPAFGLLYAGLVVLARAWTPARTLFSARPIVWLGERSYSLFLMHFPAIFVANHLAAFAFEGKTWGYFLLSRGLSLALMFALALPLFHWVESRGARGLSTAPAAAEA